MKNLFRTILLTGLLLLAVDLAAAKAQWHTDVESALKQASETKKPIMVLITGSSWCRPCQNLEKKVWSSEEFARFAKKNLVLLKGDIPRQSSGFGPQRFQQVMKLVRHNGGVPSVYLLDSKGNILEKVTGYDNGSVKSYLKRFKKLEGAR